MALTVKTCQPFLFFWEANNLTLAQLQSVFPSATDFELCGATGSEIMVYVYAVYAGDSVTIPATPVLGDRSNLSLKNVTLGGFEGKTIPTSLIDYYQEYNH